MLTFTNAFKANGITVLVFLRLLTALLCLKETHLAPWECQSLIGSKKSETCIFTVKLSQEPLLKIKPSQSYLPEVKLSSRKSLMLKTKDYLSPWQEKMLKSKWKELIKLMQREEISFATTSTIVRKLMNLRLQSTFYKFLKLKNWCPQAMSVYFICMLLLNKLRSSKWKQSMMLKLRKTLLQLSWNQDKQEQLPSRYLFNYFSVPTFYVLKSINSCTIWVDSPSEMRESTFCNLLRTVGYGFVTKIRPAKTLLDEQRKQLGLKKEENNV